MARSKTKALKNIDNKEFFAALKLLETEKGIPQDILATRISTAIITAVKKDFGGRDVVFCNMDFDKEKLSIYAR